MRKALKTRRVTGIYQLGTDRILIFAFVNSVSEDKTFYLVHEFFSAGKYSPKHAPSCSEWSWLMLSVILLSSTFEIVAVLRTFRPHVLDGRDPTSFQFYEIGAKYASLEHHFSNPRTFEPMTRHRLEAILRDTSPAQQEEVEEEEVNALLPQGDRETSKKTKKPRKKKEAKYTMRKALVNGASDYGSQLVEEVIRSSSIDGNKSVNQITSGGIALFICGR